MEIIIIDNMLQAIAKDWIDLDLKSLEKDSRRSLKEHF